MTPVEQVLQSLECFPQDLSDYELPSLSDNDAQALTASLDSLAQANPTPEARHTIAQVSIHLPPSSVLEDTQLLWAQDSGTSHPGVEQHLAKALEDGTYQVRKWLRAAAACNEARACHVVEAWGQKHFEELLNLCKEEFTNPSLRIGLTRIPQSIVLREPYTPETPTATTLMYTLATHPLFDDILRSILYDTSNHLFPVTLSTLVTVFPFAIQVLQKHVPLLMVALGRAICWRDRPFVNEGTETLPAVTKTPLPAASANWTVAANDDDCIGPDGEVTPPSPTEKRVVQLCLIGLYGAWPSNVIAFIRDHPAYFVKKGVDTIYAVPWEAVWEPGVLASRLVPLIADFQLHPSIITHTSSQELEDEKMWDRYDPSEFVSMAHLMSHADEAEGMYEFFKVPKVKLDPSLVLEKEVHETAPGMSSDTDDLRRLKEENELLRLESLYSERLRKQLIYHIGRLHRNSLRFNSDEAEIHTFVNRLKEQTKLIATLNRELSAQRSEASAAQQKHVKWQEQLRDKVSGFREERRTWMNEAMALRSTLAETKAAMDMQRDELARARNECFVLQSQMKEVEPRLQHIGDYEARMKQMTDMQLLWDSDVQRMRDAEAVATAAQNRTAELEGMLRARERVCREQADMILNLESRYVEAASTVPTPAPRTPASGPDIDPSFYLTVAENSRRRVEKLERENLELTVEVERLRRMELREAASAGAGGGSRLIYGDA